MGSNYSRNKLVISDKLIKQIAQKNATAFETVYNKSSGAVYGLAMSILANQEDAEDVVQETFISIYDHASQYDPKGKAMAWIFTIARNFAYMKIRDRKKHAHINLDDVYNVGDESNFDDEIHNEELVDVLLKTLKEDERQIVVMHAMSNMKHKDIAELMDIPLSTVISKYNRALVKLKKEMEVNEYEK